MAERESELREAGVTVVALSVDRLDIEKGSEPTSASRLLKTVGYTGKAGWATAAMAEKLQLVEQHLFDLYQPMSVPTSLLIDSAGQLAVLYRGPVTVDQLLEDVAQLPNIASSPTALPFAGSLAHASPTSQPTRHRLENSSITTTSTKVSNTSPGTRHCLKNLLTFPGCSFKSRAVSSDGARLRSPSRTTGKR